MRVFELSTRFSSISRAPKPAKSGTPAAMTRGPRTATAAAAYRACCVIACERDGKTHDYSRKRGLIHAEIILPAGAPAWADDRSKLWNAAELRERNKDKRAKTVEKANAKTAREIMFSLPAELSAEGRLSAARTIARHLTDTHGIATDFALHEPGKEGDERNFHCHLMMTTRRMGADGLGAKAREWDDRKTGSQLAKDLRAFIAATLNAQLKTEGKGDAVHVEHRSFAARGSGRRAQKHEGPAKTHQRRKDQVRARAAWHESAKRDQEARHKSQLESLTARHEFAAQARDTEGAARIKQKAQEIRQRLDEARKADRPPEGLRRVWLNVTGQQMREAFDRQQRHAQRVMDARQELAALRGEVRVQRTALRDGQQQERNALSAQHAADNRQLRDSFNARVLHDRAAERTARRMSDEFRERSQSHDIERGGRTRGDDWRMR